MTMVELMVAMTILSFAMVFVLSIFMTQHRSYVVQEDVADTQSDARASLDLLSRDLRSAGFGIQATQTGITDTTDNGPTNPDSITFQAAQGPSTYLISPPAGTTLNVANTPGNTFSVGDPVTLIGINSRTSLGDYTINNIAGTTITLDAAPAGASFGDFVLTRPVQIKYDTALDPMVGDYVLQRTVTVPPAPPGAAERLADHILNMQFKYTLNTGGAEVDTVAPADRNKIVMVRVTITSQTIIKDANNSDGTPRTRTITTLVRLNNAAS
jgi:Tfp pilus assembly protein PilW